MGTSGGLVEKICRLTRMSDGRSSFHGWRARTHFLTRDRRFLLRTSAAIADGTAFDSIVLKGALRPMGMGSFSDVLSSEDTEAVRAYLVNEAHRMHDQRASP